MSYTSCGHALLRSGTSVQRRAGAALVRVLRRSFRSQRFLFARLAPNARAALARIRGRSCWDREPSITSGT